MGPISCSSCGKFTKAIDIKTYKEVSWDRLEAWWVPICRWCIPFDGAGIGDNE